MLPPAMPSFLMPTSHGPCTHFKRVRQFKAAWGLTHLYDQVRHSDVHTLKFAVMDIVGNRTTYYRVHRGERHLTPEQQEQVKQLFAKYGYEEPTYDHYAQEIGFVYE